MSNNSATKTGFDLDAFDLPKPPEIDPKKIIARIQRKVKRNDSFLTFSRQVSDVNKMLHMKYASANDIAQVILNDVPLTSKLLKLVNSSYYSHFSENGISTISEAMIIVGTDQVKFLAASLKLIEMMQNLGDSRILKEKTLKSLQRSIIAGQIARKGGYVGSEKLQVSAILYDFGEYLVAAFAPDAWKKINRYKGGQQVDLDEAAKRVIGIPYSDLGIMIANQWNLPKTITDTMKPIQSYDVKKDDLSPEGLLPYVCSFADALCDIHLGDDRQHALAGLEKIQTLYKGLLDLDLEKLVEILEFSEEKVAKHAAVLNLPRKTEKAESKSCIKDRRLIKTGIGRIKQKLDTGFRIQDIFEDALQYMCDGFRFLNIGFCIKDKQSNTMTARYVLGEKKDEFLTHFTFKIMKSGDLFNQSLHNESTIFVDNVETSHHKAKLPLWFTDHHFSDAFAVVPIGLDHKVVSMLYMDWNPDTVTICNETIAFIENFRDLVIEGLRRKR